MNPKPRVSIIMPSFNQAEFITQTIQSVLSQDYKNIELVISDGGSTDGSLEAIEYFAAKDKRINFISQKDSGPAEALNRSLTRCKGSIIGWLNSDDLYTKGAVSRAVEFFNQNPKFVMVYGQGDHIDENGKFLNSYPTQEPSAGIEGFKNGCYICQPTVFFKYITPLLLGKLDESFTSAFDFDYWLRAFKVFNGRIGFIDTVQAQSRLHDKCITLSRRSSSSIEAMRVAKKHFDRAPLQWSLSYLNELYNIAPNGLSGFCYDIEIDNYLKNISKIISDEDYSLLLNTHKAIKAK